MDSFFADSSRKRKRPAAAQARSLGSSRARGSNREKLGQKKPTPKAKPAESDDESIESDLADGPGDDEEGFINSGGEDEGESAAQKRLRLAKNYLAGLASAKQSQQEQGFDAADVERDYIADRLQKDVLASSGKFYIKLADLLVKPTASNIFRTSSSSAKGKHRLACSGAVASADLRHLYTASNDGALIKWDLASALSTKNSDKPSNILPLTTVRKYVPKQQQSKKKEEMLPTAHTAPIWTLALSDNGKVLATGGAERVLCLWDVSEDTLEWRRGLTGHKDSIAAIVFRKGTNQIYSSSYDRTVKIFDAVAMTYVDTLFGHQDKIVGIDALKGETALTAGGSDKSLRYWKIADDSQLVFRGGGAGKMRQVLEGDRAADDDHEIPVEGSQPTRRRKVPRVFIENSIECCAMIDDGHFVSGGNSGTVALWAIGKKKPIFQINLAHGIHTEGASDGLSSVETPRWITSIACLAYSDVFATGSWDGHIRVWKLDENLKTFHQLFSIPARGIVNSLQIISPSKNNLAASLSAQLQTTAAILIAATGQEHRLGRWFKIKDGRNEALVVALDQHKPL